MDRDKMNRGGARILVRVGEHCPVLQWRRQNFGSKGKTLSKNVFIKYFLKNFEKIYKKFAQKLKNYPKFFQK